MREEHIDQVQSRMDGNGVRTQLTTCRIDQSGTSWSALEIVLDIKVLPCHHSPTLLLHQLTVLIPHCDNGNDYPEGSPSPYKDPEGASLVIPATLSSPKPPCNACSSNVVQVVLNTPQPIGILCDPSMVVVHPLIGNLQVLMYQHHLLTKYVNGQCIISFSNIQFPHQPRHLI